MDQIDKKNSRLHTFKSSLRLIAVVALFGAAGCSSLGPGRVQGDNFNYNEAIAQSTREQMLLNLVRIRYLEHPIFLKVASVLTQYTYEGDVGVAGTRGFGTAPDFIVGGANLGYSERPTVTYLPISGQEFSQQLMAPVPAEFFFAAGHAGWPIDLIMEIGLQRIGNVENMSFGSFPAPGDLGRADQFTKDLEKLKRFQRLIRTLTELAEEEAFEVSLGKDEDSKTRYFVFDANARDEIRSRIQELKRDLGLDLDRNVFRITGLYTQRQADELSVQPRSLMAMMSFLARGTEIPVRHQQEGLVIPIGVTDAAGHIVPPPIPFRILSQQEFPDGAFAAVRYKDHWFYIDRADVRSKRVMLVLMLMFSLRSPEIAPAAPALTLPAGG